MPISLCKGPTTQSKQLFFLFSRMKDRVRSTAYFMVIQPVVIKKNVELSSENIVERIPCWLVLILAVVILYT